MHEILSFNWLLHWLGLPEHAPATPWWAYPSVVTFGLGSLWLVLGWCALHWAQTHDARRSHHRPLIDYDDLSWWP